LLGKSGLLGSCFLKQLACDEDFELFALGHSDLDLTDGPAVSEVFRRISPDFVINCSAYTAVDMAETERNLAFAVNAEAVKQLAIFCARENARLIHFSTEYVFDGESEVGYSEDAGYAPINVYGESKMAGEEFISANMSDYYIIRTSWLYGENGRNFVDTMIGLLESRTELSVVDDQVGAPTYAMDLCRGVIDQFLGPWIKFLPRNHEHKLGEMGHRSEALEFGIYHLTNSGQVSRYQWVEEIKRLMGAETKLLATSSDAFPTPARRPRCSILLNTKCESLRPWSEALKAYIGLHF